MRSISIVLFALLAGCGSTPVQNSCLVNDHLKRETVYNNCRAFSVGPEDPPETADWICREVALRVVPVCK